MLVTAGVAIAMRPTLKIADQQGPKVDLETMIPRVFGGWQEAQQSVTQIVDPQTKETLDRVYSQTLSRTYIDGNGNRIMLSIAYGADQARENQVHKPEVCYPAQGFSVGDLQKTVLQLRGLSLPVMRMVAVQNQRTEPVTYWIVVGDDVIRGSIEQNIARIQYGIRGVIPDGLLFRVSSVQTNSREAYEMQNQFIQELLDAVPPDARSRLVGKHALIQK
jgi:EpsI family protein